MTNKLTLTEQEELFAKDCKLINLKYEYNGYTGDEKWAIITELSVKELWEKYPLVIERYSPFVHLSIAQGEVIDDANRNEDKYAKRSSRTLDCYGYDDEMSSQFHKELAKKGKKVLLIDADAQGSLTASLGFQEPDKLDVSLATIMANIINEEDMEPDYGILKHDEGVDLMPGNIELSGLEVSLVNVMSRELVLRTYMEQQKERYDYILIDCMPSLGMITINAFASADSILIPVQAAYLPVKGLEQLIKTIGKVKRQINPKLEIEGILLTMVDNRTNYAKDISALVVENYGSKVRIFENSIPMSVRAAEISAEGVSIYEHDPNGKVASAYQSLTEEVLADE